MESPGEVAYRRCRSEIVPEQNPCVEKVDRSSFYYAEPSCMYMYVSGTCMYMQYKLCLPGQARAALFFAFPARLTAVLRRAPTSAGPKQGLAHLRWA